MKKYVTKTISSVLLLATLGFSTFSHAEDDVNTDDDDILDLVMPAILATAQKPLSVKMTLPINEPKKNTSIKCWPGKCTVPMKKKGQYTLAPIDGYKFCAAKIEYISKSSQSNVYLANDSENMLINFNVPCSGGGVSAGGWNSAIGVVAAVVVGYFAGPQYSAGVYDLIQGTATVSGLIGGQLISNGTAEVLNANRQDGACGIGDKGNWLKANVNLFLIREGNDCPIPDKGWVFI